MFSRAKVSSWVKQRMQTFNPLHQTRVLLWGPRGNQGFLAYKSLNPMLQPRMLFWGTETGKVKGPLGMGTLGFGRGGFWRAQYLGLIYAGKIGESPHLHLPNLKEARKKAFAALNDRNLRTEQDRRLKRLRYEPPHQGSVATWRHPRFAAMTPQGRLATQSLSSPIHSGGHPAPM